MTRLLCLGDSYTIGEGVPTIESWPALAARRIGADVEIVAATGWTVAELTEAVDDVAPAPADVVTVLVGVNDQYEGAEPTEREGALSALLDRATRLAGGDPDRVLCLTIPDWSTTPFAADRDRSAISAAVGRWNAAIARLATERGHRLADPARVWQNRPPSVVDDGLHPSPEAYRAWVDEEIGPAIEAIARRPER
ncbi:MAG: SGNH/GDSL hydrolase family protein [Acidimicrobiia bacterium]|nr:SGNH/GDSL hydrolase family protein [Acidimicrobiia bacterium]